MKRYLGAILPSFLSVILFGVTVFGFLLPNVESQIMTKKREMIRELTNTVWNILATYDAQVQAGKLSPHEAQHRALGRIRDLRYGPEGKDYFWINTQSGLMIMHPYRPDLEGRDMMNFTDNTGNKFFRMFVDVVREKGAGYVAYQWQWKDDPRRVEQKVSYVKGFAPWGWIVGTGLYMDDVRAEMRAITRDMTLVGVAVLLVVTFLSGYLTFREMRAEGQRAAAQEDLRQALEKHRAVLQSSPDPVIVYDYVGRADYVNPAFTRVFGWTAEEALGASIDFVPDDQKETTLQAINTVYNNEEGLLSFESRRRTKDGRELDVMISAAVFRDAGGAPTGMVVNLTDVTHMKLAAQALRESEEKFRSISANALDGIVMIDPEGKITFWNRAASEIFGYGAEEALGQELHLLLAPANYHAEYQRAFAEFRGTGAGKAVGRMLELEARRKDGSRFSVELSVSALQLRGQWYAVGIVRDITQRKQADEDLRQSELRYRTILESVPYAISITDRETGRYLEFNDGFCQLSGYGRQEALGQTIQGLDMYENPREHQRLVKIMERDGEINGEAVNYKTKDGRILECIVSVRPFAYGGRDCVLSISQDVTALRQAEREQERLHAQLQRAQRMEAIGTLAGGVAHDFNNILQAISGYTQLITGNPATDARVARYADDIDQATQRAADLVQHLLTFSRKVEPAFKTVDLNKQVRHAVDMLARTIPKMVRITAHLAPDLRAVKADPGQLEQVLMNLGTNARDAMPDGGELRIETLNVTMGAPADDDARQLPAGEYVLLRVADSGQGMDAETLKKIYDPFFTTKEIGQGTGLGLSIVYGIVESHGGRIVCQSQAGRGTTFEIYIPAAQSQQPDEPDRATVSGPQAEGRGETILVVDDEESLLDVCTELLTSHGYGVVTAVSGEEALVIYHARAPEIDLVIMDLGMPGMGGRRALQEIKRIQPAARVLISSGYSGDGHVRACLEAGAKGFIMKPYRLGDLLGKVRETLDA